MKWMSTVFNCTETAELLAGTREARAALARGELVVFPTDTVYGLAADAFNVAAVQRLLDAKGRTRQSPPPVLVPNTQTLQALAVGVNTSVEALVERFWPGALTIVLEAQPSLAWDLGETGGTVALRMPEHPLTLEILRETGPLAVSSANKTGQPAATTAAEALSMLGESVAVYLEAGSSSEDGLASTIIDARQLTDEGGVLRVLRVGRLSVNDLQATLPNVTIEG
jgi:L-threonylcarbamoyladenylate synthase